MEKKNKIVIAVLVVIIIALAVGVASLILNNTSTSNFPNGMERYDFNSEFSMAVPKNEKFLKEWNRTSEFGYGNSYSYFDKYNKFAVSYVDYPFFTHELIDAVMDSLNKSGNVTFEVEGDMIMCHNLKNNGKIGNTFDNTNFTEMILIQKGHKIVAVQGNDMDFIKSMAETIEFYE